MEQDCLEQGACRLWCRSLWQLAYGMATTGMHGWGDVLRTHQQRACCGGWAGTVGHNSGPDSHSSWCAATGGIPQLPRLHPLLADTDEEHRLHRLRSELADF